jgi:DNA-binding protein HU-beta
VRSHPWGSGGRDRGGRARLNGPLTDIDEQELNVNKTELRDAIASHAELTNAQADKALEAVISSITTAVAGGDKVTVPGFGTFESRERSARTGRNPQTGETMEIAASKAPAFKPAAAFKNAVNG